MFTPQYNNKKRGGLPETDIYVTHDPDVAWRVIEGKAAVVSPADGTLRMLNETGTFVWLKAEKPVKVSALAKALGKDYGIPIETAEKDVLALVKKLVKAGLLRATASRAGLSDTGFPISAFRKA